MKSYKVVIFIFSVILLLGVLCAFFPAEGVTIGQMTLNFPTLEQALDGGKSAAAKEEEPGETPEEILARRLSELRAVEESQFVEFSKNSPTRIVFPDDDVTLFDSFFQSLDSAEVYPMRIVHYGDSQLEEDRITNNVREQFQERFGGSGVGMVQLYQQYGLTLTLRQARSTNPLRTSVYGAKEYSVPSSHYGPMGQACRLNGSMTVSFSPHQRLADDYRGRRYDKITILTDTLRAPITVTAGDATATIDTVKGAMRHYVLDVPDSTTSVTVRLSGNADVYGMMLDGNNGVSVDNVAMRGCSGTIFTKIAADDLADFYNRDNVKLIIMQYGGNVVPYMRPGKSLDVYGERIYEQIRYVQQQAPDAVILFIGPSDMSTNVNGSMKTYPSLTAIIDTLRSAALRAGAAYWDIYEVMGGQNSMVRWVNDGYAGHDYVHFTRKGADEVGNLLAQSLFLYYDYYKWRNKTLEQQLTPDVVEQLLSAEADSLEAAAHVDSLIAE